MQTRPNTACPAFSPAKSTSGSAHDWNMAGLSDLRWFRRTLMFVKAEARLLMLVVYSIDI
ncbi:MAG: hypothetical protein WAO19_06265 [Candidatus Kryptoniota bacterium]